MLLSVCLIAKNESLTLEKCLVSVQDIADEIIVVDTGSTDNTVEIARKNGAKVYEFEWDHDFSHARNEAIRHATGEWILVLDADEYVDEEKKQGFREFLSETSAEGVFITVINYLGSLSRITKAMPIRVMRLFRNRHLYEGAVHEQIASSVFRSGKPIATRDFVLHHVGYTEEFVRERGKSARNFALLLKELEEDPENLFHRSNLMAEYLIKGDWQGCADVGEETLRIMHRMPMANWPNFASRIHMHYTMSLWNLNQRDKALKLGLEATKHFPWYTDTKKHYANMLIDSNRWLEAKELLLQCREQGDTKSGLVEFSEGAGTFLAAHDLGVTWSLLGDDIVARRWFLQAFVENPALEDNVFPLVSVLPHEVLFLRDNIETKMVDPVALATYAEAYAVFGIPNAEQVIERSVVRYGITEQTERAWASINARHSRNELVRQVELGRTELHWFWLGLYDLDKGDVEQAHHSLLRAGARGQYIIHIHQALAQSADASWGIQLLIRDMAAIGVQRLLTEWLPRATDRRPVWNKLKHSPIRSLLANVQWSGTDVLECEQNALRFFANRDFDKAAEWIEAAQGFGKTVTQVLLRCDIALARTDIDLARKVVHEGRKIFPESEALKTASNMIHPKIDSVALFNELKAKEFERGVLQ